MLWYNVNPNMTLQSCLNESVVTGSCGYELLLQCVYWYHMHMRIEGKNIALHTCFNVIVFDLYGFVIRESRVHYVDTCVA